jgi:hypothetical protein
VSTPAAASAGVSVVRLAQFSFLIFDFCLLIFDLVLP